MAMAAAWTAPIPAGREMLPSMGSIVMPLPPLNCSGAQALTPPTPTPPLPSSSCRHAPAIETRQRRAGATPVRHAPPGRGAGARGGTCDGRIGWGGHAYLPVNPCLDLYTHTSHPQCTPTRHNHNRACGRRSRPLPAPTVTTTITPRRPSTSTSSSRRPAPGWCARGAAACSSAPA